MSEPNHTVTLSSPSGRAVVLAATLGSSMALLDGTVVNIALRSIGTDLGATLPQLQWISNGYLLALAALILLGGSLGDRFGRRRVFLVGVVWFAVASLLCGIAPNAGFLIGARVLQGVGSALLTPGSLSMIQGALVREDRSKAIGVWSGMGSIATAVGPFLGGGLTEYASWRWIFLINLPLAAVTVWVAIRHVPESRDPDAAPRLDVPGSLLGVLALAGLTYGLIDGGTTLGWVALAMAAITGALFVVVETRSAHPMLPMALFRERNFSAANAMTLLVYAALGAIMFFLVLQLQTVVGYGSLLAGVATLPVTVCMLLLAGKGGELGQRIGPRIPMSVGPLVMAIGVLVLLRVDHGVPYWTSALPGLTVFGLGLAMMVAPLTATVLAAAPDRYAGVASGVNNAVARAGSLLAVAALPVAVGLRGEEYNDPAALGPAFGTAMVACAALLAAGGVLSWLLIRNPPRSLPVSERPPSSG